MKRLMQNKRKNNFWNQIIYNLLIRESLMITLKLIQIVIKELVIDSKDKSLAIPSA